MPLAMSTLARSLTGAALATVVALGGLLAAAPAKAEDFMVQYDQAKLLRLPEPGETVIVGNPSIADVQLQSNQLLVITGKTFGVTNLIVLNTAGNIILSQRLMVKADDQKVVSVSRGGATSTFNCAPKCEPVLKIGDESNYYSAIAKSAEQKMKISEGADTGSVGN